MLLDEEGLINVVTSVVNMYHWPLSEVIDLSLDYTLTGLYHWYDQVLIYERKLKNKNGKGG